MKRIVAAVGLGLLLAGAGTVFAFRAPANRSLSHYDKRWADHPRTPQLSPDKQAAADHLRDLVPGAVFNLDRIRHAPNFVSDPGGFLTGPQGRGKGISERVGQELPPGDPHSAIKGFLKEHATLFGHGPEVLNSARLQRDYKTPHNGLQTTIWQQQVDDID